MNVATVRPVDAHLWPALEALFGRGGASNGCWCTYWILGAEYHKRPRALNKDDLHAAVLDGPSPGLLALDEDGRALGWCRVSPRSELAWLDKRLTRVDDLPVWSVPCFYIGSKYRGQGVMSALITEAVRHAARMAAPALEAYPIDTAVPGATRNLFPGTAAAFVRAGFEEVARHAKDRPIMRHYL